jgi:RNA-binding protein
LLVLVRAIKRNIDRIDRNSSRARNQAITPPDSRRNAQIAFSRVQLVLHATFCFKIRAMITLSPAERRGLKARAHHLQPVVMVGDAGLTPAVIREIEVHLKSHELIKIRVLGDDRDQRRSMMDEICTTLSAAPVQTIGKMLVIFRPAPEEDQKTQAPRRRTTRKPPRRTKRSYQND